MKVVFVTSAEHELLKLEQIPREKIFKKILKLASDPYQLGSQKLGGGEGYRIRVGVYRIVYTINKVSKVITVMQIRHRREAYK